jgi:hypothetical protein
MRVTSDQTALNTILDREGRRFLVVKNKGVAACMSRRFCYKMQQAALYSLQGGYIEEEGGIYARFAKECLTASLLQADRDILP